jgi:hypothetical protein
MGGPGMESEQMAESGRGNRTLQDDFRPPHPGLEHNASTVQTQLAPVITLASGQTTRWRSGKGVTLTYRSTPGPKLPGLSDRQAGDEREITLTPTRHSGDRVRIGGLEPPASPPVMARDTGITVPSDDPNKSRVRDEADPGGHLGLKRLSGVNNLPSPT